ncbi:MAG: formate--tetrahydrofolate ligase, partial [Saprospiraceae bacterium]|nr:formate--tetrahydrofolate ligase [Saprospiraceae bacterium]
MNTDLQIARAARPLSIHEVAQKLGIATDLLEPYGHDKAKLPLSLIDNQKISQSKLVLVSAISPTPAGEGKSTVSIGLTQALNKIGKNACVVLREPSLGPVFGIKGGATGGGYSQVIPMEDINLHFTGDFAAIEKAHNLLAALIDNNIQSRTKSLNIDPRTVKWKRVMDMNDRALRRTIVGLGGTTFGIPRETGFDITAASEVMAILCLSENLPDLKRRLGNIFVGFTYDKKAIYARDLNAHGAMTVLLKDAVKPNLVQTLEGNPAIIHGGPFANIAQGTNSVIATKMGLSLADYVVTEAGFGFDLGAEKFFDIKCQSAGLSPKTVVLVATVRALKYHGNGTEIGLQKPDPTLVTQGLANMEKHLENIQKFNVTPIVAINRFLSDSGDELDIIKHKCDELNVSCEVIDVWGKGGAGALLLAEKVAEIVDHTTSEFTPMYQWESPVPEKIEAVASNIYGAAAIDYTSQAKRDLRRIRNLGLDHLPVCIAKTQKSLSDNPELLGRPKDFVVTVREIEIAS